MLRADLLRTAAHPCRLLFHQRQHLLHVLTALLKLFPKQYCTMQHDEVVANSHPVQTERSPVRRRAAVGALHCQRKAELAVAASAASAQRCPPERRRQRGGHALGHCLRC